MVRKLENILLAMGVSVKMGRSKGRQAPTMPSDDSTMGQYTVGVRRSSFDQQGSRSARVDPIRTCQIFIPYCSVWKRIRVTMLRDCYLKEMGTRTISDPMKNHQFGNPCANNTDSCECTEANPRRKLTVSLAATKEPRTTFALESSEVSKSDLCQSLFGVIRGSHTQGRGIDRITTSVNISDQACAKYIMVVSIQVPGGAPKLVQFSEMGQHWKRLAAKKAMVHVTVTPIMAMEINENVFGTKILALRSACPCVSM